MASKKQTRAKSPAPRKDTVQPGKTVLEQWSGAEGGVRGKINMSDDVVATIAGLTARTVPGIHSLGKSKLLPFGAKSPARGVDVEVGRKEVALDLEVVIEHGCDIRNTANELRRRIVEDVNKMTGRQVVEINLDIIGIELPQAEVEAEERPRVR